MATKADFTEDEWETMRKGVTGAGMLVSIGDRDFTDTFGEVGALAKRLSEERKEGHSQLMRELAAGRPSGFGLTASPEEVEAQTLEALRSATAILAAKAPDESRRLPAARLGRCRVGRRREGRRQAGRNRRDRQDQGSLTPQPGAEVAPGSSLVGCISRSLIG